MTANSVFWQQLTNRRNPQWLVGPEPLDWRTADEQSSKLASVLAAQLQPGAGVVLALTQDREYLIALLACLRAGLVAIIADPRARPSEAMQLLTDHQPEGLLFDADSEAAWKEGSVDTGRFTLRFDRAQAKQGALFKKLLGKGKPAAINPNTYPGVLDTTTAMPTPVARADADLAYILFTSGTTSRPKGVAISWRALAAHLATLSRHYGIEPGSRVLDILPLHHADGAVFGALATAWADASLHRPLQFSIQAVEPLMHSIYRERISHFIAAPVMLSMILRLMQRERDALQSPDFRAVISVAGHLETHLWEQFETTFSVRVSNHYGLTETVTGSLSCGPDDSSYRRGTLGKPVDCDCRVVDESGKDVSDGGEGELWIRGDHVMAGYHNDPGATAQVLSEGWFRTGDLVQRDADGYYHLIGRIKNVIISGGRNISPEAVTAVLHQHPAVTEAVTTGLPDPVWGERVVAAAVVTAGCTEHDLIAWCREHLVEYQLPKLIVLLDALPRGPSGKVQLPQVRAAIEQALHPAAINGAGRDNWLRMSELASEILRVPVAELRPETGPDNTSGWDSLAHMSLVEAMEREFAVTLSARDIMSLACLGDALEIVERKRAEPGPA